MTNRRYRPRRQRPPGWLEQLLAWRDDVRKRWRRRDEEMWDKVLTWPFPVRDLITVTTVVLALGCVIVPSLLGAADFQRTRELVETQPRESATFIEVVHGGRGDDAYYVQLRGDEVEADYGWFIPDPSPGTAVHVVRDPENPGRVIAVGMPKDWADPPWWLNTILAIVALAFGLLAAFFAGLRLVPERAEPAVDKLFETSNRLAQWADHRMRQWFGDSPPSGRHSAP